MIKVNYHSYILFVNYKRFITVLLGYIFHMCSYIHLRYYGDFIHIRYLTLFLFLIS